MSYATIDLAVQIDVANVTSNFPHDKYTDITVVSEKEYETRCHYQLNIETSKTEHIFSGFDTNTVVTALTRDMVWELLFPNKNIEVIDDSTS